MCESQIFAKFTNEGLTRKKNAAGKDKLLYFQVSRALPKHFLGMLSSENHFPASQTLAIAKISAGGYFSNAAKI